MLFRSALTSGNNASFVQIKDPGLSETAAYHILRRTHSVLKENGTAVFVLDRKHIGSTKMRPVDTFFLHDMTIRQMGLEKQSKLKKLIFFIQPLTGIAMLIGESSNAYKEQNYYSGGVETFCQERGISLRYYVK